jgi:hypothetical protein
MTFQPGLFTEASFFKLQIPWVSLIEFKVQRAAPAALNSNATVPDREDLEH